MNFLPTIAAMATLLVGFVVVQLVLRASKLFRESPAYARAYAGCMTLAFAGFAIGVGMKVHTLVH